MNRNQGQAPAPFPLAGTRFNRPWLPTNNRNPLQQAMPGASQMSTGGSYGTAARERGVLPMNRPAGGLSSQPAPAVAGPPPFPFTAPWSQTQPSQPEYDHHQGFQNGSGADNSQPAAIGVGGGNGFFEPLAHSQPSHTAARLLEELQGRSAPRSIPPPSTEREDSMPILKEILEKLEAFEKNQEVLKTSIEELQAQLQNQAETLKPAAKTMDQALAFMKNAASMQQKLRADVAMQTSPSLIKIQPPPPPASVMKSAHQLKTQKIPAQPVKATAAVVQPTQQLFFALAAEPVIGSKRKASPDQLNTEEEDDDEDEVSSRLARRVQRHRRMMAQSKALAPER